MRQPAAKRDAWLVCYCTEVLAANTGLRGGEIKKVRMGQVDLENRRLVVTRASTKTDAGSRTIELNSAALLGNHETLSAGANARLKRV